MAKGKKSSGKHYTSKGLVGKDTATSKALRREYMGSMKRLLNQLEALNKGKNVVMTIANPNKQNTKERYVKRAISGSEWLRQQHTPIKMKEVIDD